MLHHLQIRTQSVFKDSLVVNCNNKRIEFIATFNFRGTRAQSLSEAVRKKLYLFGDDWEEMAHLMAEQPLVKQLTCHATEEDVTKARRFARNVLK